MTSPTITGRELPIFARFEQKHSLRSGGGEVLKNRGAVPCVQ